MNAPSATDWASNPAQALSDSLALARATATDATASGVLTGLNILAQAAAALAPIAGAAVGGPTGALAAATIAQLGAELAAQSANGAAKLDPGTQALITQAIGVGAQAISAKIGVAAAPTAAPAVKS